MIRSRTANPNHHRKDHPLRPTPDSFRARPVSGLTQFALERLKQYGVTGAVAIGCAAATIEPFTGE